MRPNKIGQVAKFHTPLQDENPKQLCLGLGVVENDERSRAQIKALNHGFPFVPINTDSLVELKLIEVNSQDLIGHQITIHKSDFSQVKGTDIKADEQKIMLNLTKRVSGVETIGRVTIIDENGKEPMGTLLIEMRPNN